MPKAEKKSCVRKASSPQGYDPYSILLSDQGWIKSKILYNLANRRHFIATNTFKSTGYSNIYHIPWYLLSVSFIIVCLGVKKI